MVERVARALVVALKSTGNLNHCQRRDDEHEGRRTDYLVDGFISSEAVARAAIEAMREPTEAMVARGPSAALYSVEDRGGELLVVHDETPVDISSFTEGPGEAADELNAAAVYRAMIAAALKDPS